MDYVSDCDSCFKNTRRLSAEFRHNHEHKWQEHCVGHHNLTTGHDADHEASPEVSHGAPHEVNLLFRYCYIGTFMKESIHHTNAQRTLLSGDLGHGNPCHGDEVQLISAKALHEVPSLRINVVIPSLV